MEASNASVAEKGDFFDESDARSTASTSLFSFSGNDYTTVRQNYQLNYNIEYFFLQHNYLSHL